MEKTIKVFSINAVFWESFFTFPHKKRVTHTQKNHQSQEKKIPL